MTLDPGTTAIVQLAWSRRLGLPDGALAAAAGAGARLLRTDEEAAKLSFVRLFGTSVLAGPSWALEAAGDLTDEELAEHRTLLNLCRGHGGRGLGAAALYFTDDFLDVVPSTSTVVSFDSKHSLQLEELCPPDDVAEVGLSVLGRQFVLLKEEDQLPLAGAGFEIWEGILAHMGVLTVPAMRRKGLASYIAAIALEEALSEGLVPQWRADVGNLAARRTAETLGFIECGSQTSVLLGQ
jgi:GNAT acetyltransferase